MSHQPERKEKNCLNCGTTVTGRFCQNCGQENIVPKQSAWGLITHFIYDILHFDGKFFHTVGPLLVKPGAVPKAYVAGKRLQYLDPVRMYLFSSALFFLLFFSFGFDAGGIADAANAYRTMSKVERLEYASILHNRLQAGRGDSLQKRQFDFLLDTSKTVRLQDPSIPVTDSSFLIRFQGKEFLMQVFTTKETTIRSESKWIEKTFNEKWKAYKRRFADDERAILRSILDSAIHKIPYLLFISLPFFALILKLLYLRRKQFYYSDHAVFTLYHYIFTFILLLIFFFLKMVNNRLHWTVLDWAMLVVFLSGGVYLFFAMKRFYGQSTGKTLVKFILLNLLAFFTVLTLLIVFLLLSVFQL